MRRLRGLPLAAKVPLLVAGLMIVLGAIASERVLSRLAALQERQLRDLAGLYFDGLSVAILPAALREDVWEAFDALDRATRQGHSLSAAVTTLATEGGLVLASSDPVRFPSGAPAPEALAAARTPDTVTLSGAARTATVQAPLVYQDRMVGRLYAEFDVRGLIADRRAAALHLLTGNALATGLLSLVGYLLTRRMLRPLGVLSAHMGRDRGPVEIGPAELPAEANEFGRLFRQYNALVRSEQARQADAQRLAEHERLVSLGRLASSVAHEINNPLGGLLNAVDTLKRHGDRPGVAAQSVELLQRGLLGIRDVVRAMIETYRPESAPALLSAADLDDLRLLVGPEIRRRKQTLDWSVDPAAIADAAAPSGPVRQAALNLLLNASAAAGLGGRVRLAVARSAEGFAITVANDGLALPPDARRLLETGETLAPGGGVGLRVVVDATRRLGGAIRVESGDGAVIKLSIPRAGAGERAA